MLISGIAPDYGITRAGTLPRMKTRQILILARSERWL
jgi:hypothetical protein